MELLSGDTLFRSPDFPLAVVSYEQDDRRLHRHDFAELVLIRSGSGLHVYEGKTFPIRAGDLLVIPEGRIHGYARPDALTLVNVCFAEEAVLRPFPGLLDSPLYAAVFRLSPFLRREYSESARFTPDPLRFGQISRAVDELELELQNSGVESRWMAMSLLVRIVVLVCRAGAEGGSHAGPSVRASTAFRLGSLVSSLRALPEQVPSVAEMTARTRLSESTLLRHFRNAFGMTPLRYRDTLRMERAAELLTRTDRSVAEIALELGFSDGNYFSRRFKALLGTSPVAYRKAARRENR